LSSNDLSSLLSAHNNCVLLYFVKCIVLCKIASFCVAVESLPPLKLACLPLQFQYSYGTGVGLSSVKLQMRRSRVFFHKEFSKRNGKASGMMMEQKSPGARFLAQCSNYTKYKVAAEVNWESHCF